MTGSIYLIPVTLGNNEFGNVITGYVAEIARSLRFFAVEDLRSARRFLRLIDRTFPIDETVFFELNEHTKETEIENFIKPATQGHNIGLMSEAGLPGIADPGMLLVRAAHLRNIRVVPLSGPSSVLLALISSGLNGQNFSFNGYLPRKPEERAARLKEIERRIQHGETQIFMETPYRAQKMLNAVLSTCKPETMLCVACDITLPAENIKTMRIADWKKAIPEIDGKLVVFIIGL
jgi:16S rRNA (cytidine1402-2'-O)-methyltransferase